MAYTAVDNSILTSSILMEDLPTRWLWMVMLMLADQTRETQGVVDCPVDRLAQLANLTVEQTKHAISRLSAPDDKSRSKVDKGRRIIACDSVEGFEDRKWRLVNWQKYKDEIRKAQMAAASRNYRAGKKLAAASSDRHQPSSAVIKPSSSTPSPSQRKEMPPLPPRGGRRKGSAEVNAGKAPGDGGPPRSNHPLDEKPFALWTDADAEAYLSQYPDQREKLLKALDDARMGIEP